MKKVLIISIAVLMVFAFVATAQASETNWRFKVTSDNGSGGSAGNAQIGMLSTAQDGVDAGDSSYPFIAPPGSANAALMTSIIGGDTTKAYTNNIKAPFAAEAFKSWDLRVAAGPDATYDSIRLRFLTLGSATLPPATFGGVAKPYILTMVNNRGVAGAPANGTQWTITAPATHNSTTPFFELTLPVLKLGAFSADSMNAGGYEMTFKVGADDVPITPEPSSLLALGSGLFGIAGFMIRRRRA